MGVIYITGYPLKDNPQSAGWFLEIGRWRFFQWSPGDAQRRVHRDHSKHGGKGSLCSGGGKEGRFQVDSAVDSAQKLRAEKT